MTRLRDRFANSWHGIPLPDSFGHPEFPSAFPTRFDIPDGEDGKVNSTSVVKVKICQLLLPDFVANKTTFIFHPYR